MAEAALFSIFMKVLAWCQTTSFGFKPSCFQVQGRAKLVSMAMAMPVQLVQATGPDHVLALGGGGGRN